MGPEKKSGRRENHPDLIGSPDISETPDRPNRKMVFFLASSLIFGSLSICIGLFELTSLQEAQFQTCVIYGESFYLYRISFFPAIMFTILGMIFTVLYLKSSKKVIVAIGLFLMNISYYVLLVLVFLNYSKIPYAGV
ncbi:MAG: hypothetical protein ACMUHU_07710 [Thermoplasmatota archaeon]